MERGIGPELRAALAAMGHDVADVARSRMAAARRSWIDHRNGVLIGGSDPRKDGWRWGIKEVVRLCR